MKVTKLAFAAIPVTEMKRARAFYEGLLDLQVADEMRDGQWIEYDLGGDTLAIANVGEQWTPSDRGTGAALGRRFRRSHPEIKGRRDPFCRGALRNALLSHGRCAGSRWPQNHIHKIERCLTK